MERGEPKPAGPPQAGAGGLSGTGLKYIAILAMIVDHVAWAFVPMAGAPGIAMHFVGRITGPVMFYFVAEGYHHTRDANRYTLRLFVFALLSWPPFYYFEYGLAPRWPALAPFGVIYTLLLGLLAVRARHEIRHTALKALAIIALVLLSSFGDWAFYGVALTLLFDMFRGSYKKQALAAGAVFAWSILPNAVSLALSGTPLTLGGCAYLLIQAGQFLPLLLLRGYNGRRGGGRGSKWFFYILYPLHLAVLGALKYEVFALPRGMF